MKKKVFQFKGFVKYALLALLTVTLWAPAAQSQDVGQLLIAIEQLEESMTEMIQKESAARKNAVTKMNKKITSSEGSTGSAVDDAAWITLQKSVTSLSAQVKALAAASAASSANGANGASENSSALEMFKSELLSLKKEITTLKKSQASAALAVSKANTASTNSSSPVLASAKSNAPKKKTLKRAKYHNLRFQDDYSYLDKSSNRGNNLFDPLKRIPVGNQASVSFGGQYRMRYESDGNRKLGASDPQSQSAMLNRVFLFADFKVAKMFRIFAEFKYAGITQNDLPAGAIAHDQPDVENIFADFWFQRNADGQFGVRVGRQELQFGKQRLISPLDWANTRRTFQGVRLMNKVGNWSIDAFVTNPVKAQPKELNDPDDTRSFSGVYASGKVSKNNTLSMYFLSLTKDEPVSLTTGLVADNEYLTIGGGLDGKANRLDWSAEAAYQTGAIGNSDISSYMLSLNGGYSFKELSAKPRIGFAYDVASGDNDPADSNIKTFNQLFPLGHAYLGWADQVGRRNIKSMSVQLSAKPSKFIVTKLNWFKFNLAKNTDALYNAGGKATRQDPTGASGDEVGKELDALVIFKPNSHVSVHMGYAHFAPGSFIENTGTSKAHDFFYLMTPIKF